MLKVELTENYGGFSIYGDYEDLNNLYDSINYLIKGEALNIGEYAMQNHVYGFLYDVRHAYQGQRGVKLIDNSLNNSTREWFDIKKKDVTDKNVYYYFNYVLTELILDMVLIKYFIKKVNKKENDIYNPYINMVNYFYSLVFNALQEILTEARLKKVKKGLLNSVAGDTFFIPQWFEIITIDYMKMDKKKREKEIMHTLDAIYNYIDYEEYMDMSIKIKKECEIENCTIDDIHYEFPGQMEW